MYKGKILFGLIMCIVILSFFLRFYGVTNNYPFWVDEFSTAHQAKLILLKGVSVLFDRTYNNEPHNISTYILAALSFKIFGIFESSARLPFVFIGSLIPIALFVVTKKIFDTRAALSTLLLCTFSYYMIVWSRQARGYPLLQLVILLSLYCYVRLYSTKNRLLFIMFGVLIFLGIITHAFYYIFLMSLIIHAAVSNWTSLLSFLKNRYIPVLIMVLVLMFILIGTPQAIYRSFETGLIGIHNNFSYYHSFLWREYGLITFLALLGYVTGLINRAKWSLLILIYITLHLLFVSLIYDHYISKYLLPIFPFLLMGAGYFIASFSQFIIKDKIVVKKKWLLYSTVFLVTIFIVVNGYKFTFQPKKYYSVNHDFREIANIDYYKIYKVIKTKGDLKENKTAIIDTWFDRPLWYINNNNPAIYIFRWENEQDSQKKTRFIYSKEDVKIIPTSGNIRFIGNLNDLQNVMKKYSKGFIFIDDLTLPKDVTDYAEKNLKKELYLDHYPLDDNPYSIWPATLYSWGL